MHPYVEILLRTIAAFFIMLFIGRLMGKQTLSNMTFHDFITGITIGAIAANLAFNLKIQIGHYILSLLVLTVTAYVLSVVDLKNRKMRKWLAGSPTVLIEDGKILEGNMRKVRYSLDSLNQSLREKDIFNIAEVQYAVFEDNGKLSIRKKEEYQWVTKKDLKLRAQSPASFPVELIMDGEIVEKNLSENGISRRWLLHELRNRGKEVGDVFYAVRDTRNQLFVDCYKDGITKPIDKES